MPIRHTPPLPLLLILLALLPAAKGFASEDLIATWVCSKPGAEQPSEADPFGLSDWKPDRRIELYEYRYSCTEQIPYRPAPEGQLSCRATYQKNGTVETLWKANFQRKYCVERVLGLVNELQTAGWYCARKEGNIEECGAADEPPPPPEPPLVRGPAEPTATPEPAPAERLPEADETADDTDAEIAAAEAAAEAAAASAAAQEAEESVPARPDPEADIREYLLQHVPAEYIAGILRHLPAYFRIIERDGRPVVGYSQFGSHVFVDFDDATIGTWNLQRGGNGGDVIVTARYVDGSRESKVHYVFLNDDDTYHFVGSVVGGKLETDFSGQIVVTEYAGISNSCPPEIISYRVKLELERQVSALADGIIINRRPNPDCFSRAQPNDT